jgi:hypothetical protein
MFFGRIQLAEGFKKEEEYTPYHAKEHKNIHPHQT